MKSKDKSYSNSYPRIVAIGFALLIAIGTGLLMLPISTNGDVSFMNAFFTATSATCITGLVPFDTYTGWSLFGKIVIITLIQIGGLGFITFLAIFVKLTKSRKMSLKQKMLVKESIGSLSIGGVKDLVKSVLIFTAATELTGAAILSIRFIPLTDIKTGILMSLFTSISAFCNAGFDLMGMFAPSSSLTTVNNDPVVIITISLLVIFSGFGFIVWEDIREKKFNLKKLSTHSKLVLSSTAVLITIGFVLFLIFEYNNTFSEMSLGSKLLNALFCSVTPRTAGFNSVDTGAMTSPSKLVTILLMFVGGSSGSTAGGVKTTTVALLFLCVISNIKNKDDVEIFGRRVLPEAIKKAISIITINGSLILCGSLVISLAQAEFSLTDIMFECTSAMSTVGMTTGITPNLNIISQLIIIALMYIGRLTSLVLALSFVESRPRVTSQMPKCDIMVG